MHNNNHDHYFKLKNKVLDLISNKSSIYLQFGFGNNIKPNFLNIDNDTHWCHDEMTRTKKDNVFIYDWLNQQLPIEDNSVDFIFHEDFIEHLTQEQQIKFLAETCRILKPRHYHRINTPCLMQVLKLCDVTKGSNGIYNEWNRWGHLLLLNKDYLSSIACTLGYYRVFYLTKNVSLSNVDYGGDIRPLEDRDSLDGNIFAELQK